MLAFSGHLHLQAVARADGRTILQQSFRAPFHLSKPYWDPDVRTLVVQVVNPTAGILEGDELQSNIAAGTGAALTVTSPSVNRVFSMRDGHAEYRQQFSVAADGWLEVNPEPLVPHARSSFRQFTRIDVEPGGGLFYVEQLVPGRLGFGESWQWKNLGLSLDVRVGGRRILIERFHHSGAALRLLAAGCGLPTPVTCFANAVLVYPESAPDQTWQEAAAALHGNGLWVGVSRLREAGWSIKVIAPSPVQLRTALQQLRGILAQAVPRLRCDLRKL